MNYLLIDGAEISERIEENYFEISQVLSALLCTNCFSTLFDIYFYYAHCDF